MSTKLSIGQPLWFYEEFKPDAEERPKASIVTYIHGDALVNLTVFEPNGNTAARTSVVFRHPGEFAPATMFCELPEQAAKAAAPTLPVETKTYSDGSSATGTAPLPDQSPAQQDTTGLAQQGNPQPAGELSQADIAAALVPPADGVTAEGAPQ